MKLRLRELTIFCKTGREVLAFVDFNYFHGRMGAGKSTIARLVDFCLGGDLAYTPALQAEFVSATLDIDINDVAASLSRNCEEASVRVQTSLGNELVDVLVPSRKAAGVVLPGTPVETISDLIFHLAGIEPPMVRRSKVREESELVRLSFRDLYWYCYLDQESMDNSFFRLDDSNYSIRLKSLDVLRLVIGFHQQLISQLQVKLEEIRNERHRLQAAADSVRAALTEEQLASSNEIERAIEKAGTERKALQQDLIEIRSRIKPLVEHATDALREHCRQLAAEVAEMDDSIRELQVAIDNDLAVTADVILTPSAEVKLTPPGRGCGLLGRVDVDSGASSGSESVGPPRCEAEGDRARTRHIEEHGEAVRA